MSQDNLITLKCGDCDNINYTSRKNKRKDENKITVKKFCNTCSKHTEHKETKRFMK